MAALRFLLSFFLLLALSLSGYAQVPDSIRTPRDISTDRFNMTDTTNLPEKENRGGREEEKQPEIYKDSARLAVEGVTRIAATRSAILPGWGQLFNGGWGYVKAPIVWAGFGGLGYSFVFAQKNYRETLDEVQQRVQNQDIPENPKYEGADTQWLIGAKDFYRRNRDLTVLLTLGWYALNVIDAYIDAKFVRYDMSDDLTFKITPTLMQAPNAYAFSSMPVVGLKATFVFK
ncbi:hypothetical protein H8S90_02090 [Olivibacter sp. SDN3]|uniref:DUF5683 domain-containing protein n=1 Tax=Olivibacter sp. SDN3 TaxID=2764720 RepID=UPI001650F29E|nr:DUF5683 domain-containing protein [Olivibacter sp. SDN3]QNL50435.1 hypothetical protein H8S90_02090 [Olivibacter sp. SDN3]